MKVGYCEEHQGDEDLDDSVANLNLPPVETLKNKGDPTLTSASFAALLPAEHLVAREACTPKAVNQGATTITWPKLEEAIKAFPICQQPIKPIRTRLPEELDDPEEPEPEHASEPQPKS